MTSPRHVFLASNLRDTNHSGISNSTAEYLDRLQKLANGSGAGIQILRLGYGWRIGRLREFALLRTALSAELTEGGSLTVEGYKAALFCLLLIRRIRRLPSDRIVFIIHDAGSHSHMRLARFWFRRANPRALHSLYRAALDTFIERAVLRDRPIAVVSQSEAAKVRFTAQITVMPPSGAREASAIETEPVRTTVNDIVLYANLGVAHLRQSTHETLRALARANHRTSRRLVVLGRRRLPARLLRVAARVFEGGVLDLGYINRLRETLASASAVWLPDLVGSGVKNRTLDALRYSPRVIATDVALEGIDDASAPRPYNSIDELAETLR